jgi:hypothetical protein
MFMPASGLGFVGAGMDEILSSSASISCVIASTLFAVFFGRTPAPPPFSKPNSEPICFGDERPKVLKCRDAG